MRRNEGRKSCPHSEMQCASSTTSNAHPRRGKQGREAGRFQALGGAEQQVEPTLPNRLFGAATRFAGVLRRERRGSKTQLARSSDLVLHKRQQGTRDHDEATQEEGRQLIAERLASARGQDAQRVAPRKHAADQLFLTRPEAAEAEAFLEDGASRCGNAAGGFELHGKQLRTERRAATWRDGHARQTSLRPAAPCGPHVVRVADDR